MAVAYVPNPGSLRELVRFDRRSSVSDGMGGRVNSWAPLVTDVPARITPGRGFENLIAQGIQATQTFTVWVRGCQATNGVTPADRIVNERSGAVYNIRAITNPDERGRFLQITCETGVQDT